jgi:hypothetical protein
MKAWLFIDTDITDLYKTAQFLKRLQFVISCLHLYEALEAVNGQSWSVWASIIKYPVVVFSKYNYQA